MLFCVSQAVSKFKASILTIAMGLKRPGSVAEVLIQLPTNIPKHTLALSIVMTSRDEYIRGYKNDSNAQTLEG
jgi:hypothetical protein